MTLWISLNLNTKITLFLTSQVFIKSQNVKVLTQNPSVSLYSNTSTLEALIKCLKNEENGWALGPIYRVQGVKLTPFNLNK